MRRKLAPALHVPLLATAACATPAEDAAVEVRTGAEARSGTISAGASLRSMDPPRVLVVDGRVSGAGPPAKVPTAERTERAGLPEGRRTMDRSMTGARP